MQSFDISAPTPLEAPQRSIDPGLYIVATPIGNLRDITLRALDVLSAADLILAEDTRVAGKLMQAYGLKKRLLRYDDHAGPKVLPEILMRLSKGEIIAQISDAGTPLISDPGFRLVHQAVAQGFKVHPLPGASSLLAALTIAGLPTDRFLFAGFTPSKRQAREGFFSELAPVDATLIVFETGPRIKDSLEDMLKVLGDREAAVCRELTKLYETCIRGPLSQLCDDPRLDHPKGEIVVVIGPPLASSPTEFDLDSLLKEALKTQKPSEAAAHLSNLTGWPRKAIYQKALSLKSGAKDEKSDDEAAS